MNTSNQVNQVNNCNNKLTSNQLSEINISFGEGPQISYVFSESSDGIKYFMPTGKPAYVDKDKFINDGLIIYDNCHLKVCKTTNRDNCEMYNKFSLMGRRKKGFKNSLVSLKNKRNNKTLKKFIFMRKIQNLNNILKFLIKCLELKKNNKELSINNQNKLNSIRNEIFSSQSNNQLGGEIISASVLATLITIVIYFAISAIGLGLLLSIWCKINNRNNCKKYFLIGIAVGLFVISIPLALATEGQIFSGWSGSSGTSRTNKIRRGQAGGKRISIFKLFKQFKEKDDISLNTHFFQIKNINKNNNDSHYFLKVKLTKLSRKIKVSQIIYVKDLERIKNINSQNYVSNIADNFVKDMEDFKRKIYLLFKSFKFSQNEIKLLSDTFNKQDIGNIEQNGLKELEEELEE